MKKLVATLLILATLCLTACNDQTTETSASTSKTAQTETTTTTQTSETTSATKESQTFETTTNETTTEKTEISETQKGYEIPAALQDRIIQKGNQTFIELPSRILFSHYLNSGKWVGDRYQIDSGRYLS